jgi:hypothetical protein
MLLCLASLFVQTCHRHVTYNLRAIDFVSLCLDVVIWFVCWATTQQQPLVSLLIALCCVAALLVLALHRHSPASYMRHRTAITTARRLLTLPHIRHVASRAVNPSGPLAAVALHLLMQTGALHNFAGSLFFLDGWRVGTSQVA